MLSRDAITTQDELGGHRIVENLGLVQGNTVRARNVARDIIASLRTIVGGEVPEYTKLMAESREQAIDRMVLMAVRKGANAIVGVRFTTSSVMDGAAELFVYGYAVKVQSLKPDLN